MSSGGSFQEKIVLNEPEHRSDSICRQEKSRLLLDLSHFFEKESRVVPGLSALLLLLLMVSVGVHLRGSLPLKWKDAPWQEAGRQGRMRAS